LKFSTGKIKTELQGAFVREQYSGSPVLAELPRYFRTATVQSSRKAVYIVDKV